MEHIEQKEESAESQDFSGFGLGEQKEPTVWSDLGFGAGEQKGQNGVEGLGEQKEPCFFFLMFQLEGSRIPGYRV